MACRWLRGPLLLGLLSGVHARPAKHKPDGPKLPLPNLFARDEATCYAFSARPRCLIFMDRHTVKTGGTSIRDTLQHMQASGVCQYWGFSQYKRMWPRTVARIKAALNATPSARPAQLRLCMEAHTTPDYSSTTRSRTEHKAEVQADGGSGADEAWRSVWTVHGAMLDLRRLQCRVVLTARVRQPLPFYRSYYFWRVLGLQQGRWDFAEWASGAPDLQAHAIFFDLGGDDQRQLRKAGKVTPALLGSMRAYLASFDLVWPLERFDDGVAMLSSLTGLDFSRWALEPTVPVVRGAKAVLKSYPWIKAAEGGRTGSCASFEAKSPECAADIRRALEPCAPPLNRSRCEAVVQSAAPADHELYRFSLERFERAHAEFVRTGVARSQAQGVPRPPRAPPPPARRAAQPSARAQQCSAAVPAERRVARSEKLGCTRVYIWINASAPPPALPAPSPARLPRGEGGEPPAWACTMLLDGRYNPCMPLPYELNEALGLGRMKVHGFVNMCPPYCAAWVPEAATGHATRLHSAERYVRAHLSEPEFLPLADGAAWPNASSQGGAPGAAPPLELDSGLSRAELGALVRACGYKGGEHWPVGRSAPARITPKPEVWVRNEKWRRRLAPRAL